MVTKVKPLEIWRGSTFQRRFKLTNAGVNVDLAGSTAKMQIRPFLESSSVILELSTENGRITFEADPNDQVDPNTVCVIVITLDENAAKHVGVSEGVTDLIITSPNGDVSPPIFETTVVFDRAVTR